MQALLVQIGKMLRWQGIFWLLLQHGPIAINNIKCVIAKAHTEWIKRSQNSNE